MTAGRYFIHIVQGAYPHKRLVPPDLRVRLLHADAIQIVQVVTARQNAHLQPSHKIKVLSSKDMHWSFERYSVRVSNRAWASALCVCGCVCVCVCVGLG